MIENIKDNWRLINPALILSLLTGLIIFAVKVIGYPRMCRNAVVCMKEFITSFNYALVLIIPVFLLLWSVIIIRKKIYTFIVSSLSALTLYLSAAYVLNRIVFAELFRNKTLIAGIKVRLVYVTPKALIPNLALLIAFAFALFYFYKWLNLLIEKTYSDKMKQSYKTKTLYNRNIFVSLVTVFAVMYFGMLLASSVFLPSSIEIENKTDGKVYVLGLDGADWRLLDPLLDSGKLPNLAKLINNGSRGVLLSPANYIQSGPSWTSIATGLTVAQHGITSNTGFVRPKRVWNVLDHYGYTTVVVNWLCSPFPEILKGLFITGPYDNLKSYPQALIGFLKQKFGVYHPDVDAREISDKFVESCFSVAKTRAEIIEYISRKTKPDFLAVNFTSSDRLQHFMWQYYEPELFEVDKTEISKNKYSNAINDYYIEMDKHLGRILATTDPEKTTYIVLSDHGFEALPQKKVFTTDMDLNYFLQKIDLFRLDRNFKMDRTGMYALETSTFGKIGRTIEMSSPRLADYLVPFFKSVRIKHDGKKCFTNVRVEDGKIKLQIDNMVYKLNTALIDFTYRGKRYEFPLEQFIHRNKLRTGDHRREGIIILSGRGIKKGTRLPETKVYDVTPTILALMNLPLSWDSYGIPITEAFTDEFLKTLDIKYVSSYKYIKRKFVRGKQDMKEQQEKLRSLGYIN